MINRVAVVVGIMSLGLAGCAGLSPEAQAVRLIKSDPGPECTEVGNLRGSGFNEAGAKNSLKKQAAKLGADTVRMETFSQAEMGSALGGTAYKCKK